MKISRQNIGSILILLLILVGCGACWADVVEPGTKQVDLSYQVLNTEEYPDYVFLFHGVPNPEFEIINDSKYSFYKLSQVSIYAMKKSDYNKVNLSNMNYSELDNFFNNNSNVIKSEMNLSGSYGTVSSTNPLDSALILLKIDSVTQNQLNISKMKIIYYFNDGSSQSENFIDQNTMPEPQNNSFLPNSFYVLIVIIVITLLILFIVKKKRV